MSCCPPDSAPFLSLNYVPEGNIVAISGAEFYEVNPAATEKVIIIIPDAWGWNSGRIRNIADLLSKSGYRVVVPKIMQPPFEGGTDGDGLPPSADFATRGAELFSYLVSLTWDGVIRPIVNPVLDHLRNQGGKKFGVIGFCWGGAMATNLASENSDVVGLLSPHPSLTNFGNYVGMLSKVYYNKFQ